MRVRDAIKLVEEDGWYQVHQVGSHRQFKHPLKRGRVTIAGKPNQDLHPKTLRSVLTQAQINLEEWPVYRYTVVIEKGPKNYSAYVPDLPGCVAAAETREEVRRLMREAIELHLRGMIEDGDPVPNPTTIEAYCESVEVKP